MCASFKIVNPPAGSERAGRGPGVNRPCQARPGLAMQLMNGPGWVANCAEWAF